MEIGRDAETLTSGGKNDRGIKIIVGGTYYARGIPVGGSVNSSGEDDVMGKPNDDVEEADVDGVLNFGNTKINTMGNTNVNIDEMNC